MDLAINKTTGFDELETKKRPPSMLIGSTDLLRAHGRHQATCGRDLDQVLSLEHVC